MNWPKDLLRAKVYPKDVFGTDLDQLDPIRTADEVFIVPGAGGQKFEIVGYQLKHIQSAEQHYINLVQKVQMKTFGATHPIHIILDGTEGNKILLEAAEEWWPNRRTHRIVPRLIPVSEDDSSGSVSEVGLEWTQFSVVERTIQLALRAIRFEKGHYELCVRYGCLALRHHPRSK